MDKISDYLKGKRGGGGGGRGDAESSTVPARSKLRSSRRKFLPSCTSVQKRRRGSLVENNNNHNNNNSPPLREESEYIIKPKNPTNNDKKRIGKTTTSVSSVEEFSRTSIVNFGTNTDQQNDNNDPKYVSSVTLLKTNSMKTNIITIETMTDAEADKLNNNNDDINNDDDNNNDRNPQGDSFHYQYHEQKQQQQPNSADSTLARLRRRQNNIRTNPWFHPQNSHRSLSTTPTIRKPGEDFLLPSTTPDSPDGTSPNGDLIPLSMIVPHLHITENSNKTGPSKEGANNNNNNNNSWNSTGSIGHQHRLRPSRPLPITNVHYSCCPSPLNNISNNNKPAFLFTTTTNEKNQNLLDISMTSTHTTYSSSSGYGSQDSSPETSIHCPDWSTLNSAKNVGSSVHTEKGATTKRPPSLYIPPPPPLDSPSALDLVDRPTASSEMRPLRKPAVVDNQTLMELDMALAKLTVKGHQLKLAIQRAKDDRDHRLRAKETCLEQIAYCRRRKWLITSNFEMVL